MRSKKKEKKGEHLQGGTARRSLVRIGESTCSLRLSLWNIMIKTCRTERMNEGNREEELQ